MQSRICSHAEQEIARERSAPVSIRCRAGFACTCRARNCSQEVSRRGQRVIIRLGRWGDGSLTSFNPLLYDQLPSHPMSVDPMLSFTIHCCISWLSILHHRMVQQVSHCCMIQHHIHRTRERSAGGPWVWSRSVEGLVSIICRAGFARTHGARNCPRKVSARGQVLLARGRERSAYGMQSRIRSHTRSKKLPAEGQRKRSGVARERSREVSVWYAEQDSLARSEKKLPARGQRGQVLLASREVSGRSGQYHMQSRICLHAEQEIARE